jgi:hypothetical protein
MKWQVQGILRQRQQQGIRPILARQKRADLQKVCSFHMREMRRVPVLFRLQVSEFVISLRRNLRMSLVDRDHTGFFTRA